MLIDGGDHFIATGGKRRFLIFASSNRPNQSIHPIKKKHIRKLSVRTRESLWLVEREREDQSESLSFAHYGTMGEKEEEELARNPVSITVHNTK